MYGDISFGEMTSFVCSQISVSTLCLQLLWGEIEEFEKEGGNRGIWGIREIMKNVGNDYVFLIEHNLLHIK